MSNWGVSNINKSGVRSQVQQTFLAALLQKKLEISKKKKSFVFSIKSQNSNSKNEFTPAFFVEILVGYCSHACLISSPGLYILHFISANNRLLSNDTISHNGTHCTYRTILHTYFMNNHTSIILNFLWIFSITQLD